MKVQRLGQAGCGPEKSFAQFEKPSQHDGIRPFHMVIGENPGEEPVVVAGHGVAEEETVKPGPPGIFPKGGKTMLAAGVGIDSPTDVGGGQPLADQVQIARGQP
ncbi:hypothetical protein [Geotalea toluenoxydans]|uniref:hypothetical protein n=1 Tax=Geotalea toluenoxydans TaxID=421624 RepID=UPI0034E24570